MTWTPIKPGCEMPEEYRHVLVTVDFPLRRGVEWVYFYGGICRTLNGERAPDSWRVLAWAPLPEPWRGETGGGK